MGLMSRDFEWAVIDVDHSRIQGLGSFDIEQSINGMQFFSENAAESFPIRGVLNPEITDIQAGLLSLAYGRVFTTEEIANGDLVAVVSQTFAAVNNLYVGATLPLHSAVHNDVLFGDAGIFMFPDGWLIEEFMIHHEILELEIVGIFEVEQGVNYEISGWDAFLPLQNLAGLHNRIYIPVTLADRIMRDEHVANYALQEIRFAAWGSQIDSIEADDEPTVTGIFLLHDPRDLPAFTELASELLPEFWSVADTAAAFAPVIASMDTMLEIADLILIIAAIATVITLSLTITLLLKDRRHEIGIYLALGEKKARVVSQFLIEIFLVTTVGIVLALFVGNLLSEGISRSMLEQTLTDRIAENPHTGPIPWELALFNPGEIPIAEVLEMYNTALDRETVLLFIGVSFVVVATSVIIPLWMVVKMEPKKILL